MAVGFQVVLIVGQTDVIVPENLSAAANYNCVRCLTYALASQLVLTLDGPLSATAWPGSTRCGRRSPRTARTCGTCRSRRSRAG